MPRIVFLLVATTLAAALARGAPAAAQDAGPTGTIEVGKTGFSIKRPVLASACEDGCPWGELGDFLAAAMQPLGYDVIQCRNCDQSTGPPIVSKASHPPPIGIADTFVGTTTRVDAPVDFGITGSGFLSWAYHGLYSYAPSGPYATGTPGPFANLRLIAKIEDGTYLLVAVKKSSGITDLSQIADQRMAVTILGGGTPISQPVLDYYGLTQTAVASWGGAYGNAIVEGQSSIPTFDIIVSELGSPANNPESEIWPKISQLNDLTFLDLPVSVLNQLASDKTLGLTRVTAKWGLLRGVDRPIATVGRSGHAVFCRDDAPEQAVYDVAKAIDEQRAALRWYIRPYSYDPRTVWQDLDVPLHPGAQHYFEDAGYIPGPASKGGCAASGADASPWGAAALLTALGAIFVARGRTMRSATAHPLGAPSRIARRDLSDERGSHRRRSTQPPRTSSPHRTEPCPVPAKDRRWLNE